MLINITKSDMYRFFYNQKYLYPYAYRQNFFKYKQSMEEKNNGFDDCLAQTDNL